MTIYAAASAPVLESAHVSLLCPSAENGGGGTEGKVRRRGRVDIGQGGMEFLLYPDLLPFAHVQSKLDPPPCSPEARLITVCVNKALPKS